MEARGAGCRQLCFAVLCAGAVLTLKGGDQNITQHSDIVEGTAAPTAGTEDVDGLTLGPVGSAIPPGTEDPTTITVPPQEDAPANQTRNGSGVPIRYWSPVIFVVLALLVLFLAYRRTKGEGTQDPTTSLSDFADAIAPDHDMALIVPSAQEGRKGSENPLPQELSETPSCQPAPFPEQPAQPTATCSPRCSGVFDAD